MLTIDGAEQSLIDPHSPATLDLEYTARLGAAVDAAGPAGEPLRALHLGGGGLSLARYIACSRPGSDQLVVEREEGLLEFVLDHAPLPSGSRVRTVTGDAAGPLPGIEAELVILDVYDGTEIPEAFFRREVLAHILTRLAPEGVLAVNVADDADHRRLQHLRAALESLLPCVRTIGSAAFLAGRESGNAIVLASVTDAADRMGAHLLRAGPHPSASWSGDA